MILRAGANEFEYVYARSNVGRPWGVTTNEMALDAAFNASWSEVFYEEADVNALFTPGGMFWVFSLLITPRGVKCFMKRPM